MARLNIESKLWADPRFQELMIRVGNRHTAKGMILELWTLAQESWFPDRQLIPPDAIERAGLKPVLDAGLAEVRPGGVYACGSEEAFAWLFQKQEAGKRSAESKKGKRQRKSTPVERPLNARQRDATSSSTSFSSSFSPSDSSSSSISKTETPCSAGTEGATPPSASAAVRSPIGYFIGVYVAAYQARYGEAARPDLRGKVQGEIKRFLAEHSLERACDMIQTYCAMSDQWFITKAHDFSTFLANLSKVGLKLDTGHAPTRADAAHAETGDFHRSQMERVLRGEL